MADFAEIRSRYVCGEESFRQLAKAFNMNASTLRNRAAREGWTAQRNEYRTKARQIATEISAQEDAKGLAKVMTASGMLDDVALSLLRELTENGLDILTATRQPCRELESLSKCLSNNEELKRRLYGLLSPRDQAQIDLARERLEFERSKEDKEEKDTEIRVVLSDELKEWGV